jgi:hypothetical protein
VHARKALLRSRPLKRESRSRKQAYGKQDPSGSMKEPRPPLVGSESFVQRGAGRHTSKSARVCEREENAARKKARVAQKTPDERRILHCSIIAYVSHRPVAQWGYAKGKSKENSPSCGESVLSVALHDLFEEFARDHERDAALA